MDAEDVLALPDANETFRGQPFFSVTLKATSIERKDELNR